jgi:predicted nucleic acid-binding protein
MPTGKLSLFWDTCAYIALISEEERPPEEIKKLFEVEQFIISGRATVFTSVITLVEILDMHFLTEEQRSKFALLLNNRDTVFMPIDSRVGVLARDIRDYYHRQKIKILVPDSIQLAAAIYYEADVLHTYDGCGKTYKRTDLLRLPRPILGNPEFDIEITIPQIPTVTEPKKKVEEVAGAQQTLPTLTGAEN